MSVDQFFGTFHTQSYILFFRYDGIIFSNFPWRLQVTHKYGFWVSVSLSFLMKLINQYGRYLHEFNLWFCTSTISSFFKNNVIWHSNAIIDWVWVDNKSRKSKSVNIYLTLMFGKIDHHEISCAYILIFWHYYLALCSSKW